MIGETAKRGVIFGYRAVSDYGSFEDGQGHVYNFGRSTQESLIELEKKEGETFRELQQRQKELLRSKMRRTGLNGPSRVLMWVRVDDVDKYWDEFKDQLHGWGGRMQVDGKDPHVTQQVVLGDFFYTVENMGVVEFGAWCNAMFAKILE